MGRAVQFTYGPTNRCKREADGMLLLVTDGKSELVRFQEGSHRVAHLLGKELLDRALMTIGGRAEVDLQFTDLESRIPVISQDRDISPHDAEFERMEWDPPFWNQMHQDMLIPLKQC